MQRIACSKNIKDSVAGEEGVSGRVAEDEVSEITWDQTTHGLLGHSRDSGSHSE